MSTVELQTMLRAGAPVAPERLRTRVRELRPRERRLPSFAPRRLLVVAVPLVAAGVVVAAVAHGLASSGPRRADTATATGGASAGEAQQSSPRMLPPDSMRSFDRLQGHAATPPLSGAARLRRYEASLTLRVADESDLSQATARASQIATALGGYAASVQYRTPAGRPGESYIELRVPTARVQDALARLHGLGTILSQQISVQDLQRDFERQTAQIAQLRRNIRLLLDALKDPALTPVQRVQLQIKLADAKRALAQRTHARKATVAAGTLARVSLVLTTARKAAVPHHESRLGRMLGSAAGFLALEATVALYVLVVASPLALLALLAWAGARLRRRRDEQRLLAAS